MEAFLDLFNIFNQQEAVLTDDNYTYSWAAPIVNGTPSDLKYAKDISGAPIAKNPNYGHALALPAPVQRPLRPAPDVLGAPLARSSRAGGDGGRRAVHLRDGVGRPAAGAARAAARIARRFALASRSQWQRACSCVSRPPRSIGIEAAPIDVEVDVGIGLPCCNIVGLADAGIREGRRAHPRRARQQRLQAAAAPDQRSTSRPPICARTAPRSTSRSRSACCARPALVDADGARRTRCSSASWRSTARCGRCAACCRSRPGRAARGVRRLVVPPDNAGEAAIVGGVRRAARRATSGQLVALLRGERRQRAGPERPLRASAPARRGARRRWIWPTCAARRSPRRALEIAAAGGHNLLFVGPPGCGQDDAGAAAARHPAAARRSTRRWRRRWCIRSPACSAARR